jgi:hypothetical protein
LKNITKNLLLITGADTIKMGKEPRVRLQKFPLPATQDPYSFHIRMAALRRKFQKFDLGTASYSSPKPSSDR